MATIDRQLAAIRFIHEQAQRPLGALRCGQVDCPDFPVPVICC